MYVSQQKSDSIQFWVLNIASFFGQLSIAMVNLALVYHLRRAFFLGADQIGVAAPLLLRRTWFSACLGGVSSPYIFVHATL